MIEMKTCKVQFFAAVAAFAVSSSAFAWMDQWAPALDAPPAKVQKLSPRSVRHFVTALPDGGEFRAEYSKGGALDLNGDKVEDFVFFVPWMGNGLNASGDWVYFIVSDGKGGRKETVLECYGADLDDLVTAAGKVYFRQSAFFEAFEKSAHSHWVYQLFAFDAAGDIRCANADFGTRFPAATIFYDDPKFKPVQLTPADLKKIAKGIRVDTKRFTLRDE